LIDEFMYFKTKTSLRVTPQLEIICGSKKMAEGSEGSAEVTRDQALTFLYDLLFPLESDAENGSV
jgi:hypothetical protein